MAEAEERLSASARAELLGETPFRLRTIGGVSAPRALHEVAEDEDADVIVLGSTHRGGLGRVLPGSVGERLLHGAPVRGADRAERLRRPRALRDPQRSASATTARPRPATRGRSPRRWPTELGARLETITVPRDGGAEPADPGEAATELVERSRELDLLVVGSRGYGPVRHALLGSVTAEADAGGRLPGAGRAALEPSAAERQQQALERLAGLGAGAAGSSARATSIATSSRAPSSAWESGSIGWRRISPDSIPAVSRAAIRPSP